MGAWGTAVFSDDFACDIRDNYNALLINGNDNSEATTKIFEMFYEKCKSTEDEPVFWFALALSQWKKGRMTEEVKLKAIEFIESGEDLKRWDTLDNQQNYKKRKKELQNLKLKLLSPMPVEKKISKPTITLSPWKTGDLLAYKIVGETLKYKEFINKYALLRVLKVIKHPISSYVEEKYYNETVLLGLYNWIGDSIPEKDIVQDLEFAIICDYVDPVLGRQFEKCMMLSWSKNELKKREIVVLESDGSFESQLPDFFDISFDKYKWYNLGNLDLRISLALKQFLTTTQEKQY